jgi:uncharacterized protein (TIGR02147 family)
VVTLSSSKTQATQSDLSIFGYTDYRDYLRDYYEARKQNPHGYSFRQFSKDAGFRSPNVLKLVMEGQRNISQESVEKFVTALRLNGQSAEYFRTLVKWNHAKSDAAKKQHFATLRALIPRYKKRLLNADTLEFLSHWLHPILREMVGLQTFSEDPHWIVRRLNGRTSVKEITQAVHFLTSAGFIAKQADGSYGLKDDMILTEDEVSSLAIRQYHRVMLQQAAEMLEDLPVSEREFGSLTIGLPEHALAELKRKLKAFRSELHVWAMEQCQADNDTQVIQVNFQMYPQTRKVRS